MPDAWFITPGHDSVGDIKDSSFPVVAKPEQQQIVRQLTDDSREVGPGPLHHVDVYHIAPKLLVTIGEEEAREIWGAVGTTGNGYFQALPLFQVAEREFGERTLFGKGLKAL